MVYERTDAVSGGSMKLVLLGPPGAGKGTQGDRLADRCGVPKYATGDILRDAVRRGTHLGRDAKRYMDAGELVPDGVVLGLVREAMIAPEASAGFILDGFPRTVAQAEGLHGLLEERGTRLDAVVYFDVPEEELVRRLAGRRVCPSCGAPFNVHSDPPAVAGTCDKCGSELETREDDREDTVRVRLRVYREHTKPLLEWYGKTSTLRELDAVGSVDEIFDSLLGVVGR
jgi:adenylate kinase